MGSSCNRIPFYAGGTAAAGRVRAGGDFTGRNEFVRVGLRRRRTAGIARQEIAVRLSRRPATTSCIGYFKALCSPEHNPLQVVLLIMLPTKDKLSPGPESRRTKHKMTVKCHGGASLRRPRNRSRLPDNGRLGRNPMPKPPLTRRDMLMKWSPLCSLPVASPFSLAEALDAWERNAQNKALPPTPWCGIGPLYKRRAPHTARRRAHGALVLRLGVSGH